MRLTQKELKIIKEFVRGRYFTISPYEYQKEVIDFVQESLRDWKPFPQKPTNVTMKAQYKGRKKPLSYVLEEKDD